MGRKPWTSSNKEKVNKGSWTAREDKLLADHIKAHGQRKWSSIPKQTGLKRCGKSCRLRWLNYLRPNIKRGNITPEEEDLIIRLHKLLGNRWSLIAGRIPGRTDNEIKNYWNSYLWKKTQPENGKVVAAKARQSEEAAKVEDPSQLYSNICNMVSSIREADQPESSDASLTSSLSSAALTVEEDLSDMLMNFYTREMSLSEFLDTDFKKFGNVISNVAMVRGDPIQRTPPPYARNEADDVEAPMSLIMSQEMVDNLGFTDFGFQLSAVFTDFADDEEHWNITKLE